jgi:hypothetical protein
MKQLNQGQCVVCGEPSFRIKPIAGGWDIYKCVECGLEFCRPMPTGAEFDRFYANYSDPRAGEAVVEANAERNIRRLAEFGLGPDSRVLDYGCGQGAFCRVGRSKKWVNFDPYKNGADDPKVLVKGGYDWVTLWGVLEHVADPVEVLKKLSDLLSPGGKVALTTVWTQGSIPYQHKPPEHVTYWTRRAMEVLFDKAGITLCLFDPYVMVQDSEVYLNAVLRTVPKEYRVKIHHDLGKMVEVPTNEILVVGQIGG